LNKIVSLFRRMLHFQAQVPFLLN